jgi:hypothetical protein
MNHKTTLLLSYCNFFFQIFRDELEIDPEDFNGRRTPLYLAVKLKQPETARLLIANGASVRNVIFGKTVEDLIDENLPNLRLVSSKLSGAIIFGKPFAIKVLVIILI